MTFFAFKGHFCLVADIQTHVDFAFMAIDDLDKFLLRHVDGIVRAPRAPMTLENFGGRRFPFVSVPTRE